MNGLAVHALPFVFGHWIPSGVAALVHLRVMCVLLIGLRRLEG